MLGLTPKALFLVGGESLLMLLICVHGGGWYKLDLCNCTIRTCRLVVIDIIIGVVLLGLNAEKSATVYNCSR